MVKYIPDGELTFNRYGDAVSVAKTLMDNGYVVMLSKEEDLFILNWVWSETADRNDTVFMSRCDFDLGLYEEKGEEED